MTSNSNSFNGNSTYATGDALNEQWRSFPLLFRWLVPAHQMSR